MLTPRKHLTKKELHKDPIWDRVASWSDYFQANQKLITYGIAAIAISALMTYFYMDYRKERNDESINKLVTAEREYLNSNYREAIRRLEKFCTEYEGTVGGGAGTFYLANSYFNTDQFDFARQYFEQYVSDYGDNELFTVSSMLGVAACYEGENKFDEAVKQYEKTISKYDDSFLKPEAMLSLARCYRMMNQSDNAKSWYQKISKEFPESSYAREAKVALDELGA